MFDGAQTLVIVDSNDSGSLKFWWGWLSLTKLL